MLEYIFHITLVIFHIMYVGMFSYKNISHLG